MERHALQRGGPRGSPGASLVLLAGGLLLLAPRAAAGQLPDTADARRSPVLTPADGLLLGGFALAAAAAAPFDADIAAWMQDPARQRSAGLDAGATTFGLLPAAAVAAGSVAYLAGRRWDRPGWADLGLHWVEAVVVAEGAASVGKLLAGRARPLVDLDAPGDLAFGRGLRGRRYRAFPSGHAAAAFASAAVLTSELPRERRRVVGPLAFGAAALVGASRLYTNDHWASDVVVGAALGTLSGFAVVRYHHARTGEWPDRWLLSATVVPGPEGGVLVGWSRPVGGGQPRGSRAAKPGASQDP